MADKTPNYDLTKPLASEFYDIEVQNDNMDRIDRALKDQADEINRLRVEQEDQINSITPEDIGAAPSAHTHNYADKSVQKTVEAVSVPYRTVTVAAEELPEYVASLPRLLTEALTISVTGGELGKLEIHNFYGSGRLTIRMSGSSEAVCTAGISIRYCAVEIYLLGFHVTGGVTVTNTPRSLYVYDSSHVEFGDGRIDGAADSRTIGVTSSGGSAVYISRSEIVNCKRALYCNISSMLTAFEITARENVQGAAVYNGGIIMLNKTPDTLGGSTNFKQCGLIVDESGALL